LAFDSSGNLFVGGYTWISKFSPAGTLLSVMNTGSGTENFGLAIDSLGNLYSADSFANLIRIYSPAGAYLGSWSGGLDSPETIAFNSLGELYVNNYYNVGVTKFSSSGTNLGTVIPSTQVQYGYGLGFDASGNLFVATGNLPPPPGQVQGYGILEYSSGGTFLGTLGNDGGWLALTSIPEPSSVVLCASGLALLVAVRKRVASGGSCSSTSTLSAHRACYFPEASADGHNGMADTHKCLHKYDDCDESSAIECKHNQSEHYRSE
jgi:hypothetical protein